MDPKRIMDWFVPATPNIAPVGAIVLPTGLLVLNSTGFPGIFLFPDDIQYINQQPCNLSNIEDKLLPVKRTVCYSFCPTLETTVIPMDLHDSEKMRVHGIEVKKTNYFLQHPMSQESLSGYRATVKLDFMIWHVKKWTRRFQINGAVLLDPKFKYLLMNPDTPICFLGMDFMIKHPHLLFEPGYDSRHELEFRLAEEPFMDRSYEVSTNAWKEVIIHVDGHHNVETGNIGCGVFFKSGSIFNFFGGVSKCDAFGNELEGLWIERGILVAIVKALQIFEALSVEGDSAPKTVIIKTSSPEIEGMLTPIKWFATRIQPPYGDQRVQALENIFPPTVRDVVMYYYHTFVQRQPGFKIKIQHVTAREKSGGILAARLLATAGAEMDEFCMTIGGNGLKSGRFWDCHNTMRSPPLDTISLETHPSLGNNSIYVSFGIGGYFLILREKASAATQAADKAGLELPTEDATNKLENALQQIRITMPERFANSVIHERKPRNSPSLTTGTRSPNDSRKRKAKIVVSKRSQKSKNYNRTAPQRLSEFDNDWSLGMNDVASDSTKMSQSGLGVAKLQINFVRYPPYPTRRVPNSQDQERIERMAGVQNKRINELQASENLRVSHSGVLGVLEMWKIQPEVSNATGENGMCGMGCECRIEDECGCQVGCRCEVEFTTETKARPESEGVEEAVREDKTKKIYIHKFSNGGGSRRYTEANRPHITEVKSSNPESHAMGKPGPSGLVIPTDQGWPWEPIPERIDKGKAEAGSEVSTNERPADMIRYNSSKAVEPPIEHEVRLKGYVRRRGIPQLYESQFEESIHCELPNCPSVIIPTQTPRVSEEQNCLEAYRFPRGRELLKRTPAAGRAQTQKYSERQKHRKGIRRESCLLQYSNEKDEAWSKEF